MRGLICDVLDVFSPTTCPGCDGPRWGRQASTWCPCCVQRFPRAFFPVCPIPDGVESAWGFADYRGVVGTGVRRGKYRPDPVALSELGLYVGRLASECGMRDFDVVAPVPQSLASTIARGFSPVSILASCIAKELGVPWCDLLRSRSGISQASLPKRARQANISGRYGARNILLPQRILLVDDVVTTGATASACAGALRGAGAGQVCFLAVTVSTRN